MGRQGPTPTTFLLNVVVVAYGLLVTGGNVAGRRRERRLRGEIEMTGEGDRRGKEEEREREAEGRVRKYDAPTVGPDESRVRLCELKIGTCLFGSDKYSLQTSIYTKHHSMDFSLNTSIFLMKVFHSRLGLFTSVHMSFNDHKNAKPYFILFYQYPYHV